MSNELVVAVLNQLLAAEHRNLIRRLGESNPFVTWPAAEDRAVVERLLADTRHHQQALAGLILKLRGSPAPATYPTELGGVHYLNLSYLMPQVIAGVRELVRVYEGASGTGHPEADVLISRILGDHTRHLSELERMHANLAGRPVTVGAAAAR